MVLSDQILDVANHTRFVVMIFSPLDILHTLILSMANGEERENILLCLASKPGFKVSASQFQVGTSAGVNGRCPAFSLAKASDRDAGVD
jgi:hypothetical protein